MTEGIQPTKEPLRRRGRPRTVNPREPLRDPPRGLVATGRDGEVLTRRRTEGVDPFHIPPELVPAGWTYQWNTISVIGNTDICLDQGLGMYENGWRPVPAQRHPGRFVPHGTTGAVVRGGMRLEERPVSLTEDAQREAVNVAKRLISDRNESVMGEVKNKLGSGIEMSKRYRGTGGELRMSIDKGLDIPAPQHQLAEPGE
jgi:hypothetical protein